MNKKCCMCSREITREDAPILGIGGAGNERVLCDDCEAHLENATSGRDYESIKASINTLSDRLSSNDPDRYTFELASELLLNASKRAKAINEGTYDFSLDEEADEDLFDEIPEELLESEEDKQQEIIDAEKSKKYDRIYNIILITLLSITAGYMLYYVITSLLN